jgi:hypothetical protein
VWDGYPCSAEEDEESDYYGGLFLNLERCARLDPSGQTTKAIRIAFALGQASIAGTTDLERVERFLANAEKQERRYKKGGTKTGPEAAADAKERYRAMKEVWAANRDKYKSMELVRKVRNGEFGFLTDLKEDRVKTLFGKWAQEAVIAAERETWATIGWDGWSDGIPNCRWKHHRSTHDGYLAQLFETDDGWRLKISAPPAPDKPGPDGIVIAGDDFIRSRVAQTHPGISLDDAKAAIYWLIERDREREVLEKRQKKGLSKRMEAREASASWSWF